MPRVLDTMLEELNLNLEANLNNATGFTNLGGRAEFHVEAHLQPYAEMIIPVILTGGGEGYKIWPDDANPLQIYHRLIDAENEESPTLGYGKNVFRFKIYNMRLVCFGTLRRLNDPNRNYNTEILQIVYNSFPKSLSEGEQIFIGNENANMLSVLGEEIQGADTKYLSVIHIAFSIEYQIKHRNDCGAPTYSQVVVFNDIAAITDNSYVITT